MKILFFIEGLLPGGKERRLVELLTGLKKYEDIHLELVLTKSEIHYAKIHDLDIPIYIIERKFFRKDPRLFYQFYRIAKKVNPDIIHVWGNLAAIYAIPTKILLNIPMLNNQIADAPAVLPKKILSYKLTFPFSDLLITNSKAGLMTYKPSSQKSMVIYNGLDFNRLNNLIDIDNTRTTFNVNTDFVVGMVASFSKYKDYKTYIQAAILVLKSFDNVTFLCVGAGSKQVYQKMVPHEYKNNILFIDAQKDILSLMNICNMGVLATYTEGISNSIMEFMALGKPVIATDGGGTKELIVDSLTGYLVQKESASELSEKILKLLNDQSLCKYFGRNGKIRIEKEFGINSMIEKFVEVYYSYFNK